MESIMQLPWVGLLEVPQKHQLKPMCVSLPSVATGDQITKTTEAN